MTRATTIALAKVDILPPDRVTDDTGILTLKGLAFEPLLAWDAGRIRPALFASWTHDDSGRRWTFRLRPGARFHDGRACSVDDVLSVIDGLLASVDTFGMRWSYARYLAGARFAAGPDGTVTVETPDPFADLPEILTEFHVSRPGADGRATLGTGPYRVTAFEPRRHASLERVDPDGPGPARIDLVEHAVAEDRWRALVDGAVDVAVNLDHMHRPPSPDPRFAWQRKVNTLSVMFYLNGFAGPFRTAEARLAANLAVDKEALVRDVFHGLAAVSSTIVGPWHFGAAAAGIAPIPHDPDRARRLLDAAGTGGPIRLRTPTFMPERAPEASRFVADALDRVGFAVTVETETDRPEYARQVGRKEIGDLAIFDSSPHSTFRVLDDKISSATRAVWWQGHADADRDRMIAAAGRTMDPAARERAYGACLRRLNADPPWLYLVHPVSLVAARPGTPPFVLTAKGTLALA